MNYDDCYQEGAQEGAAAGSCRGCPACVRRPQASAVAGTCLDALLHCCPRLALADYDNYLDIILDASSERAARAVTTLKAYYTREGYASVSASGWLVGWL